MKIYTGTGDSGKTSLFSGERLPKNDARVAAYGTVDELCSFVGVIEVYLPTCEDRDALCEQLREIQGCLFTVGALLATSSESEDSSLLPSLGDHRIQWLEELIDTLQDQLEELHSFILPGGHAAAAYAQVARAVCRRAEREIIGCAALGGVTDHKQVIGFVNRLSDYLFVLGRYLNKVSDTEEIFWHG